MMDEFYKTPMGKKYYERDLPALIESNKQIAKAQQESNALAATQIKQENRRLQLEQRKLLLEMKVHGVELKDFMTDANPLNNKN
jgi:hypothetical protein